jgi:hypothetical protein
MRVIKYAIPLAFGLATIVPAQGQTRDEKRLLALVDRAPSDLVPLITVTGDEMDPSITISTRGVTSIVSKGLLASTTTENSWLRAFVDKKTGAVTVQVYHSASYNGRGFDSYLRATYESPDGVEQADVSQIGTDISCSRYSCTHYADLVFPVSLAVLRAAAKAFNPSEPRTGLKYRIFAQSGNNVDDALPGNEIAAFVQVIDREIAGMKR